MHRADAVWTPNIAHQCPPWHVVVLVAGILVVNGLQEGLLASLLIGLEFQHDLAHHPVPVVAASAKVLLVWRWALLMASLVWAAQQRTRLQQQCLQLADSRSRLRGKLVQSLQTSAMAHELRQPLSHLLIQVQLCSSTLSRKVRRPPAWGSPWSNYSKADMRSTT